MKHTNKLMVLAGAALSVSSFNALAETTTVNKDEVRAIVSEMLADAQTRSSLLQGQGNAGYDKKFFLASPDNNYRLNIGGYVQFRYGMNFGEDDTVNEYQQGFSFRTARLEFGGHVINPDLKFLISGDFADTQSVGSPFYNTNNTATGTSAFTFNPTTGPIVRSGVFTYNNLGNNQSFINLGAFVGPNGLVNPSTGGITTDSNPIDGGVVGVINGANVRANGAGRLFIDFNNNGGVDAGEFIDRNANGALDAGDETATGGVTSTIARTIKFRKPAGYTFTSSGFALKDAVIDYTVGGGWYVRGGQYKLPFLKEELVSDTHGLSAERSISNSIFTGGRGQGVGFGYRDETFRFMADYSDGFNTPNTPFSGNGNGGIVSGAADYAFTFRGEYAFAGNLDDWKQFTSQQDDEFKAYVGAAFHIQGAQNDQDIGGAGTGIDLGPNDPQRYVSYTIDAGFKGSGFSLFAAFIGANTRFLDSVVLNRNQYEDFNDFGVNVTGAWRFVDSDEIFARWDGLFYDGDRFAPEAEDNYHFLTVGWNHYFAGQAARFTVDSVIALTETQTNTLVGLQGVEQVSRRGGSPFGDNQMLYGSTDTGQVGLRFQFQLMF